MSDGNQAWGDRFSDANYTDERFPRGTKRFQHPGEVVAGNPNDAAVGERVWIFAFNDEAATAFAEGHIVTVDTGDYAPYDGLLCVTTVPAGLTIGVAQYGITAGRFGYLGRSGVFEVEGDGGVAAGEAIVPDTTTGNPGQADTMAAGEEHDVIGVALEADTGTPAMFTAVLTLS